MNPPAPHSSPSARQQERQYRAYAWLCALAALACLMAGWLPASTLASPVWLSHAAALALLAAALHASAALARWRCRRQAMAAQPLFSEAQRRLGQALAQALLKPPSAKRSHGDLPWRRARRWVGRHLGWSLVRLAAGSALPTIPGKPWLPPAVCLPSSAACCWNAS